MTPTQSLIAKIQAATEGSRELDVIVARALGEKWKWDGPRTAEFGPLASDTDE